MLKNSHSCGFYSVFSGSWSFFVSFVYIKLMNCTGNEAESRFDFSYSCNLFGFECFCDAKCWGLWVTAGSFAALYCFYCGTPSWVGPDLAVSLIFVSSTAINRKPLKQVWIRLQQMIISPLYCIMFLWLNKWIVLWTVRDNILFQSQVADGQNCVFLFVNLLKVSWL